MHTRELSGHRCAPHAVLEDVVLECIKDAYAHQIANSTAQAVLTEDKRHNVYQNLHTAIPRTIRRTQRSFLEWDIMENDEPLEKCI